MVSVDNEVEPETVAALGPDLVVGTDYFVDLYDRLAAITPTVLLSSTAPDDRLFGIERQLAELTGVLPERELQQATYEQRVRALRKRNAADWARLRWIVFDEYTSDAGGYLNGLGLDNPAFRVLSDLGASLAPSVPSCRARDVVETVIREIAATFAT